MGFLGLFLAIAGTAGIFGALRDREADENWRFAALLAMAAMVFAGVMTVWISR